MIKLFDIHEQSTHTENIWGGGTSVTENNLEWWVAVEIKNDNISRIFVTYPNRQLQAFIVNEEQIEDGPDYQKATITFQFPDQFPEYSISASITIFRRNHPRYRGGYNTLVGQVEIIANATT